jgi:hypothetical protein
VGGLVVGMTSVGSGSLMVIGLLFIYPRLGATALGWILCATLLGAAVAWLVTARPWTATEAETRSPTR